MSHKFPLVAAQPGIWRAEHIYQQLNAWSVSQYIELIGELNKSCLIKAILTGIEHADTLRIRFQEQNGEVMQWIDESLIFETPQYYDLRHHIDPHEAALELMQADLNQDLRVSSDNALVMHKILQLDDNRWYWYQRYHHLQVDGFSLAAITQHIGNIYCAYQQGLPTPISPFSPFYNVVDEYVKYQQSDAYQKDKLFWAQYSKSLPLPASLSSVPLTELAETVEILRTEYKIDSITLNRLSCAVPDIRQMDMIFAIVALWLGRLSSRMEYAIEFLFMCRMGSAALTATGAVVNMLPMAIILDSDETLPELAKRLAEQLKILRRHQRYNTENIVRERRKAVGNEPLFAPSVNIKMFEYPLELPNLQTQTHTLASGPIDEIELMVLIGESGEITIELLANAQIYQQITLQDHLSRITLMLEQFSQYPALRCGDVNLQLDKEREQLALINKTQTTLPDMTLSELVIIQAQKTPDAIALIDSQWQFSYREMREQVMALAAQLQTLGVKPEDCVAVALPRSVFLTVAIHAIAEVGAAWLPLDVDSTDVCLQMRLKEAQPVLVITSNERLSRFENSITFCYNAPLPSIGQATMSLFRSEHTAYILFTSGATGQPKGVMVGQTAIVNRILWMQASYPLTTEDVVILKTPCSFDVSVWEFWWPFIAGAKLVMAEPEAHRNPLALYRLFNDYGVTTAHFVPSMLSEFIRCLEMVGSECCGSLKRVFCSGEGLPTALCRRWEQLVGTPLYHLYGLTEAAIDVAHYNAYGVDLARVKGDKMHIGYPIWNIGLRILDSELQPVPFGVAGDLYISGVQLAKGYLNQPELAASRFIADPVDLGKRIYRTNDIARWLESGAIEYIGRRDFQLKIRGQNIEFGEIEAVLLAQPDIAQAVVHACILNQDAQFEGDQRQLVGYVVASSGQRLNTQQLQQRLCEQLPSYMIPVAIMQLDSLPLSNSGKLDRQLLPLPQLMESEKGRIPVTAMELLIAEAFSQLLGCEIHTVQADFFALGGDSLLAIRLAAQLSQSLGRQITAGQIMFASTIEKLSRELGQCLSEG